MYHKYYQQRENLAVSLWFCDTTVSSIYFTSHWLQFCGISISFEFLMLHNINFFISSQYMYNASLTLWWYASVIEWHRGSTDSLYQNEKYSEMLWLCITVLLDTQTFLFLAYSFDGLVVFGLIFISTCAYMKKVPRLKNWLLSEKKGFFGVFYKGKPL